MRRPLKFKNAKMPQNYTQTGGRSAIPKMQGDLSTQSSTAGLNIARIGFYIFLTTTVAMRFLFAWAYHRGGNSVLSNMLFHTASNMAYGMVALAPTPDDMSTGRLWMFDGLTV
jgi:hypothetical protein